MNPALRRSSAHVFVDDLAAPALSDSDAHHLDRVLRLRDGEVVSASDGAGSWRSCTYSRGGVLVPASDVEWTMAARPPLTIGFALAKGDRPEWIVQKLTELGVDNIAVVQADRSVVHWDGERAAKNMTRLASVAREAAMQSRRVYLPVVAGPVLVTAPEFENAGLAEPGGETLSLATPVLLVGPEGGWSERELATRDRHFALGKLILRVETAAVAAAVGLVALRDRSATE